jgi:hypothetical protein
VDVLNPVLLLLAELFVVLGLLLWADRWLHRHLQGVMYLLSNDEEIAIWLYAIILLPGVLLHEVSHALAAAIVGVRIGRINILPRRVGKRIQLGFVPVQETDFVRASFIGAAPLFCGGLAVVALGYKVFGAPEVIAALAAQDWLAALKGLSAAFQAPDAWIWAYLVFAIGNTMLPSRSDIHAWPFIGFAAVVLAFLVLLLGGGALLMDGLGQFLTVAVRWIVLLGSCTLLIDLPFFALIFVTQKALEHIKGVRLEYR